MTTTTRVATFCPLCVSRCGAQATVEDGRFVGLEPDPDHPTGRALCVKGKAAPEIVDHPDRLLHPMKRTNPKGAPDPGWQRISWDEALDTIASELARVAAEDGPEAVVFASASPSTSAMSDSIDWLNRLRRAFGSPHLLYSMELCGWGRTLAPLYTYGAPVPGAYLPDLDNAGCILFWGYNPSVSRLTHATATTAALRRGARLVVVDPRRAGLAAKARPWVRVRPGTDAALALSITGVMIDNGWFDETFVRRWTNAPLLVRADTGRLLRAADAVAGGTSDQYVAWDEVAGQPVVYDPSTSRYAADETRLALHGEHRVNGLACRPVFALITDECRAMSPDTAEQITGVPAEQVVEVARILGESGPVAFYTWCGLEQQSNATQTARAVGVLYALTGCLDAPGGNVSLPAVPSNPIDGAGLLSADRLARTIGAERRPLGPARFEMITGEDFYTAALDGTPYRARALLAFGSNMVMAHGDSGRGRDAVAALDFYAHTDLFLGPTAELADIVLPVTSAFEGEGLRVGFEVSEEAQSLVQLRRPVSEPRGEARPDLRIVFDLAVRLGLGEHFFDGDVDAAWRHQLEPSGVTLDQLRADPAGVRVPLVTRHRKYAEPDGDGPRGFRTPTRKIELFSETLAEHGHSPVPVYDEPSISPRSRPDLTEAFPLVLTCAKSLRFCGTQHREVPGLRRAHPDPLVEIHPDAAAARGIAADEWVRIETPKGRVRARARFNTNLDPGVVCAQHGWWQPAGELGLPGFPAYGPDSANLNLVLAQGPSDPVSGSSPLRASLCQIAPLDPDATGA